MATARQMHAALRAVLVPAAAAHGFHGSLPHLERTDDAGMTVLSLQTDKRGGGLRLEIGFIPVWLRALRPRTYPSPATRRSPGRTPRAMCTAYHAPTRFRHMLTSKFVRYDELAPPALPKLAARLTRIFLENGLRWLAERERAVPLRDGSAVGRAVTELARTYDWALDWLLEARTAAALRTSLGRAMAGSDVARKMFVAWALAKAGNANAHAFLVTMLDDPPVRTRYRSDPGQSIRAAQALADIHGWRFSWSARSVPGVKRRVSEVGLMKR
jgi:hypothetical protein